MEQGSRKRKELDLLGGLSCHIWAYTAPRLTRLLMGTKPLPVVKAHDPLASHHADSSPCHLFPPLCICIQAQNMNLHELSLN